MNPWKHCTHDPAGCCWLCSWDAQPWWPEARQKALDTGVLEWEQLSWDVRRQMNEQRYKVLYGVA